MLNSELESVKTDLTKKDTELESSIAAHKDYVKAYTKGTDYTYREWASGIKELWQTDTVTTAIIAAWGDGLFIIGPITKTLKKTFSTIKNMQVTVRSDTTDTALVVVGKYTTSSVSVYLVRGEALTTAAKFYIDIYVEGT